MSATLQAKSNGTEGALLVNGSEVVTFGAQGISAGYKDQSIGAGKLSGLQSGAAPIYGARAWCIFNGTLAGTNAPLAGGNVTSVTRTGPGQWTINFAVALPTSNFAVSAISNLLDAGMTHGTLTTESAQVSAFTFETNVYSDASTVAVVVFG